MSTGINSTGFLPAFSDYAKLGVGYAILLDQFRTGHRMHAYLLVGPRGVGKATFARFVIASLFCEGETRPCGHCAACGRVFSGNEPDVLEISSPDGKTIPIERVREAIAVISQHSLGSGPRVVVVEPAEKLTPAAQNCLLKSLEEPPDDVIFFLLSHEPSALLGTIASRCSMIKLAPWPDESLTRTLQGRGYTREQAEAVLPLSAGNIGMALLALADEADESVTRALIEEALSATCDADVVALSTRLKDDRDGAERALRALELAFHQALLASTGIIPLQSVSTGASKLWGQNAPAEMIVDLLREVFEVRKRRLSQVNWQASIDRLLMKIVEARTKWQQS